jgi:pimeloyl-ACP methyl ester carboxylesterase
MKLSANRLGSLVPSAFALALVLMTASAVAAQERVPRFEPGECPFDRGDWAREVKLECGWLVVPEVRERPQGRMVRLAVAILRAKEPNGDPPLVMLHGGPGGSGLRTFTTGVSRWPLAHQRDIVIYDQRGSGFSEPKLCPEYQRVSAAARNRNTLREKEKDLKDGARTCVASLRAQGIEPAAYNTGASGADLIDLRHVLGYAKWDVYSGSYGARLAQEAMRRDPTGIRSVVLESPVARGPTTSAEFELSIQRALERVFADCAAQPACRTAFPTVESDFYAVYGELKKTPLPVPVKRVDAGRNTFPLDGSQLVGLIHNNITNRPARIAQLPWLMSELRRGDKMRAAQTLVGYVTPYIDQALPNLVFCFDDYGADFRAARKSVSSLVRLPFRNNHFLDDLTNPDTGYPVFCKVWQKRFADSSEHAPIRSGIPTLILTADSMIVRRQSKSDASLLRSRERMCTSFRTKATARGQSVVTNRSLISFSRTRSANLTHLASRASHRFDSSPVGKSSAVAPDAHGFHLVTAIARRPVECSIVSNRRVLTITIWPIESPLWIRM